MKKILICGSHFTSAQAVIEKLLVQPGIEVVYVGRRQTMEGDKSLSAESKILPKMGVKYYSLTTGRFSRSLSVRGMMSLFKIPVGMIQAIKLMRKIKPAVVLSFGGYISVPVVIAAKLFRVPVMLHEQTLVSGLSNRISGFLADRIGVSFEDGSYDFDKKKVVLTGNPIRAELMEANVKPGVVNDFIKLAKNAKKKILFVTGGNQGAQAINQIVAGVLDKLEMRIIWQTGDSKMGNFENASLTVEKFGLEDEILVRRWFDASEVNLIFRNVDLVVCRGGINTLSEIAFFGQKAIVIPYPYLYKDEQLVNGKYFEKLGYARVILQSELSGPVLIKAIESEIKRNFKADKNKVVILDAAERVVSEVLGLIRK